MDELLHHWQISLISQGRLWVYKHKRMHTHATQPHTQTYTHRGVCVDVRARSYTHAFYQSNLIGESMLWLANRELMQSRGLSSPLPPPVSIFTYLSLSCPSPPLSSSRRPFFYCFFLWKTSKQHEHVVYRQGGETRPADWWAQWHSFDFSWIFIKRPTPPTSTVITIKQNRCFLARHTRTFKRSNAGLSRHAGGEAALQ